jgi:DNA-binding transcriptional LysR family regulator
MHVDSLKVFCDLVESGSFSAAAAANSITQSAVSQQVRNLEARFGCTLLERSRRGVTLTPEGQIFYAACRDTRSIWANFDARLKELKKEVAGELRIASIFSIGLHDLPARLHAFQAKYPHVSVKVEYRRSPQIYEMVKSGAVHLGLVAYPARRPGLSCEVFAEDRLVLICHPRHPLASRKRIQLSEIAGQRFIGFEPDTPTRKMIDRHLRQAGVKVVQATEFDNVETVKRAVEIESGISIVPARTVAEEVESGQLCAVEIESPRMTRPLATVVSRTLPRPRGLKEFIAVLKGGWGG